MYTDFTPGFNPKEPGGFLGITWVSEPCSVISYDSAKNLLVPLINQSNLEDGRCAYVTQYGVIRQQLSASNILKFLQ